MDAPLPRIGHHQLLRRLGAGGMGEVFLARDTRLEREVALKVLPPDFAEDQGRLERFRREALALASLNHPGIATLFAIEPVPGGGLALVMEYVPGETLAARLERGALSTDEALRLATHVAEALEVAHERGAVHGDLKPANIAFSERGTPKVLDFGLARRGRAQDAPEAMAEGASGDASSAPAGGASPDHRVDVFAFGCVLVEMLAGPAASRRGPPRAGAEALAHEPPDLAALPPELADDVRALIARCVEPEAAARPAHMREVREALELARGITRPAEAVPDIPHALPTPRTAFVGRARELAQAREALRHSRLITLTGVGGCGKTRLALALAQSVLADYEGGAWFVDLAPLADAERVPETVAQALAARLEPDRPLLESIIGHIGPRPLLLLLDNCEHLLGAAGELIDRLLNACAGLQVLVTSREGLGLPQEQIVAVPSLAAPGPREANDPEALARFDAVQLFLDRARAVRPDFALDRESAGPVAEVCRRLDGIPLAIELAAARVKVLGAAQIAARLDDRFKLLTGGSRTAMPRHQTLRATIQWSHDLLLEPERELLRRLAAFAGGWTLADAARVVAEGADEFEVLDVLQQLIGKSLVMVLTLERAEVRYRMLESVRQFAAERLEESGESFAVRSRHLACFLERAEHSESDLVGPQQAEAMARLDLEQENLLASLTFCAQAENGGQMGLRLASSLWRYWGARGLYELGRRVLVEALTRPGAEAPTEPRAHALVRAGGLALYQGDYRAARPLIEESLAIYRALGDSRGVARALSGLAVVATYQGDYAVARACNEESLAGYRALGQRRGEAVALHNLGYLAWCEKDGDEAELRFRQSMAILREVGDRQHLAITLAGVGSANVLRGEREAARQQLADSLKLALELGAEREGLYAVETTAGLIADESEAETAVRLLGAARSLRSRLGTPSVPAEEELRLALLRGLGERLGATRLEQLIEEGRGWDGPATLRAALESLGSGAAAG